MKKMKGTKMFFSILAILVLLVGAVWYFDLMPSTTQSITNVVPKDGCQIAPSVNVLSTDSLVSGTTPSLSANYSIYDGSYVGSIPSSPSAGKSLDVLATATNYLNAESKINALGCSGNDLKFAFTPYAAPTYTILDANYNTLTDAIGGGAFNETASANQITDTIKISGTPLKSTGDMLIVIEYTNKTEVASSGISIAGASAVDTPTWYTVSAVTSSVRAFEVPAIVNGGSKTYDLTLTPESGQTMATAGVYTTIYTLEPVVLDTNKGKFLTEKTWQDSLGASKVKGTVDYDFYIK